jgi:cell division protein FtsL
MRFITTTSVFLALASAFLLYGLNYDTRQLEARVQDEERAVAKARSDIAVLKAERAHLTRPDRIEPLARAQGLAAATDKQFARDVPIVVGAVND